MTKMKKLISVGLAAMFVVSAFASCADNNEDQPKETRSTGAVTDVDGNVPVFEDRDFDEAEFKFLIYDESATDYLDDYIWSESLTGGTIGDAVSDRNREVEERYNVKVVAEAVGGPMGEATKRMQAGQCDFDIIYEWGIRSKSAALDSMLYDFLDLDYVDFDQSYWVPSATDDLTVGGHLFIYTNMITMNSLSWADILFFNKNLIDKLNMTVPYDYVNTNNWVYDVYLDMVLAAEEDVNGDGQMTLEDQYGQVGTAEGELVSFCRDGSMVVKNDDGSVTLTGYTERMLSSYQKYSNKLKTTGAYISYEDVWANGPDMSAFTSKHSAARYLSFGEGHTLFMGGTMDITKELVNMQDTYGVVPSPVYDSSTPFSANVDCNAPMFSIPIQAKDYEKIGIILEYMAYQSEQILLPAYYETTIKTKRMEDTEDYKMLDIVRDNTHYNWTGVYLWDTTYSDLLSKMVTSGNFKSVYARYGAKCQAEIDEVVNKLLSIE